MSCECTLIQKHIPFTGGCCWHDDRKVGVVLLTFFVIMIPIGVYYSGISAEEYAISKIQIEAMSCIDLRYYLASDPRSWEQEFAETNFKWKCLEAGKIDLTIDDES